MTLEKYINENITESEQSIFYNEQFCNITIDYISCHVGGVEDMKQIDITYLNSKGYEVSDFFDYL